MKRATMGVQGTGYVTLRARVPFNCRGLAVEAGDRVTLPSRDAIPLERLRRLEHLCADNIRAKLYASRTRQPMELKFE